MSTEPVKQSNAWLFAVLSALAWFLPGAFAGARLGHKHHYGVEGFLVAGLAFAAITFGFSLEETKTARGIALAGVVMTVLMSPLAPRTWAILIGTAG